MFMTRRSSLTALALAIAGLTASVPSASAQQDASQPAWAQGRPESMQGAPLAPHAAPLTVTPEDQIPVDRLRLPDGFSAELWAHGMPGARMMALGDEGTLFVGTRSIGRVYAVTDNGESREHRIVVEGLTQPNGVAFKDGSLYVAAINPVLRFDDIESQSLMAK